MTVRTPSHSVVIADKFEIPSGNPIHIPIYSLQNSTRDWLKPKQFIPERWLDDEDNTPSTTASSHDLTPSVVVRTPSPHAADVRRATEIGIYYMMKLYTMNDDR